MSARLAAATLTLALSAAAFAQAPVKADPAKAQQIASQVCAACHGADGNSVIPANPVIAGQHPAYTYKQLMNFRADAQKPAERTSPVMTPIVAQLSPEEMAALAVYYGAQEPKLRTARNPELVKLGRAIYRGGIADKGVAACAACHGPNGAGIPAQFPRLAGQHAQYVMEELRQFRSGERANDASRMMRLIAERLSDREIEAVAQYIQGLR